MSTYFITGASRGIGLGLVREALQRGAIVFAGARTIPSKHLEELQKQYGSDKLHIVPLDVTSETSVQQAYDIITKSPNFQSIDVLINNAGQMINDSAKESLSHPASPQNYLDIYNANVVGPMLVSSKFTPVLSQNGKLIHISSLLGSLTLLRQYKVVAYHSYSCSKSALNMLNVLYANEFDKLNEANGTSKISVSVHPGHVQTELGGEGATVSVEDSTRGILDVVQKLDKQDNGAFVDYTGAALSY